MMKATVVFGLLFALPGIANAQGGISGIKISNLRVDGLDVDVDVTLQATDTCVLRNEYTTNGSHVIQSTDNGCRLLGPRSERSLYQAQWPIGSASDTSPLSLRSGMTLLSPQLNAVDWGDGNAQTHGTLAIQATPVNSWKGTFSHTYSSGTYNVTAGVFRRSFDTVTTGNPLYAASPLVRVWSSTWASTYTHNTSWVGLTAHTAVTVPTDITPSDGGPEVDGGPVTDGGPMTDGGPTGDSVTPMGDDSITTGDIYQRPSGGGAYGSPRSNDGCNATDTRPCTALLALCGVLCLRRRNKPLSPHNRGQRSSI